ncbi:hypothetical protein PCA10_53420 [Metapseudomonas resinovorans NBRC 106553]|uniref:Uncharacterized protein n=2 Tax=Metapseudomonas resinovorans TaxID=53412 RepID=S6BPY7_METRE|nr:hypothetical protein PCA10_53420 [Pseudomonas resinovorans NBRC 106553]
MQLHIGVRKEGDVLRLKAMENCSELELARMLRTEGIEIVVGPMEGGRSRIGVRAPRSLSLKVERLRKCQSTASYLPPLNH